MTKAQKKKLLAALIAARDDLQDFVNKVDKGRAQSVVSYARFKATLPLLNEQITILEQA